jgi:GNAT superfamily N-acetyltransferase
MSVADSRDLVCEQADSLRGKPMVEIAALVVDQNHRSLGIGSKLAQRVEDWAWSRCFRSMSVRSNVKLKGA